VTGALMQDETLAGCGNAPVQSLDDALAAVQAEHVAFRFGGRMVLDACSFSVQGGRFTALVGDNGAGKSTLVRLIIGELAPCSGSLSIGGIPSNKFASWEKLGYVPQDGSAGLRGFPATVEETVRIGLYALRGLLRPLGRSGHWQVQDALREVGLEDLSRRKLSDLSGGQRQRVLLARALAGNPELLILDEPTSGIDAEGSDAFFNVVSGLCTSGRRTVIMVTHDLERARRYADEIMVVEDHRVYALREGEKERSYYA